MALTPNSSPTAYCDATTFLLAYDPRDVGQIVSFVGTTIAPADLVGNPVLGFALLAASGEVESACLVGQRYAPTDLQALQGASQAMLQRLVADLAFAQIHRVRGLPVAAKYIPQMDEARERLKQLGEGEAIFAFLETEESGTASDRMRTVIELNQARLLTRSSAGRRFLPRSGGWWGGWGR